MNRMHHVAAAIAVGLVVVMAADASDGEHRSERHDKARAPLPAQYVQECGSCHLPYAPRLLPAESWRQLTAGLAHHFGVDASLDGAATESIASWLAAEARVPRRPEWPPAENRITRAAWFVRKHREVEPATWRHPAVKSASNCAACHAGADRGDFDDHAVRIPR
jgi:hypothetical protein